MTRQNPGGFSVRAEKQEFFQAAAKNIKMTGREMAVARLLYQGKTLAVIARELALKLNTVKSYVKALYWKLRVHNRIGFVRAMDGLGPPQ